MISAICLDFFYVLLSGIKLAKTPKSD